MCTHVYPRSVVCVRRVSRCVVGASRLSSGVLACVCMCVCVQGCSSVTFPAIMGPGIAHEVLYLGRKLTAVEARDARLVTRVVEASALPTEVTRTATAIAALPPLAMRAARNLVRDVRRSELEAANKRECALLQQLWQSQECATAIAAFAARKTAAAAART